jgi:hypothetical protein
MKVIQTSSVLASFCELMLVQVQNTVFEVANTLNIYRARLQAEEKIHSILKASPLTLEGVRLYQRLA